MPADVNLNIDISKKGKGDEEAAAGLEVVAKAADNAKDELAQLDRKLVETRLAMIDAGKTFAQTGDISPFKALLKDQRQLESVRKGMTGLGDDAAKSLAKAKTAAEDFFQKFLDGKGGSSISNSLIPQFADTGLKAGGAFSGGFRGALSTFAGPVAVAFAVPLVAALGAALSGGALATAAFGGIATGLILQLSNPGVKAAAADLGSYLKTSLTEASSSFASAAEEGFRALKGELSPVIAQLGQSFQSLSPYLTFFLDKLGQAAQQLMPGLTRAIQAAGPVLEAIGNSLPTLARGVNVFFDEISKGSRGATEAIAAIFKGLSIGIAGAGFVLRFLSDAFENLVTVAEKFYGVLAKVPGLSLWAGPIHQQLQGLKGSFDASGLSASDMFHHIDEGAGAATAAIVDTRQAMLDFQGTALSASQAAGQWRQGLLGMADAVKQNGTSLKEGTANGEANIQMLQGMVDKARAVRDAQIAHGISVSFADQQYRDQIGTLIANADHLKFNKQQVENLIGQYRQVPGSVSTTVLTPGLVDAISRGETLASVLRGINGSVARASVVTTYLTIRDEQTGTSAGPRRGVITAQAKGGIVAAATGLITSSPMVLFGERQTRREAYIPERGISDARGLALADQAAGWHGGRVVSGRSGYGGAPTITGPSGGSVTVALTIDATPGTLEHAVLSTIRATVVNAGGNVQAALGRRGH